jgi:hypothetical protein
MIKPKRKTPSMSANIKKLRERIKESDELSTKQYYTIRELREEIRYLKQYVIFKFYRIDFKMKASSGSTFNYSEVKEAYSPQEAIEKVKKDKTYPDTFELVDIKVLA